MSKYFVFYILIILTLNGCFSTLDQVDTGREDFEVELSSEYRNSKSLKAIIVNHEHTVYSSSVSGGSRVVYNPGGTAYVGNVAVTVPGSVATVNTVNTTVTSQQSNNVPSDILRSLQSANIFYSVTDNTATSNKFNIVIRGEEYIHNPDNPLWTYFYNVLFFTPSIFSPIPGCVQDYGYVVSFTLEKPDGKIIKRFFAVAEERIVASAWYHVTRENALPIDLRARCIKKLMVDIKNFFRSLKNK